MYWLDIVLLIPLLYGVYKGFRNGLIKEVISLFSFAIGLFVALKFSSVAKEILIENNLITNQYAPIASVVVTFIAIVVLLNIFGRIIEKLIKVVYLGIINKIFGAVFGVIKYLLLVGALALFLDKINQKFELINPADLEGSILYLPVLELSKLVLPIFRDLI